MGKETTHYTFNSCNMGTGGLPDMLRIIFIAINRLVCVTPILATPIGMSFFHTKLVSRTETSTAIIHKPSTLFECTEALREEILLLSVEQTTLDGFIRHFQK